MTTPFSSAANGSILSTAFTASKLYARSSSAIDAGTLTVSGIDDVGSANSEALTLAGKVEVSGADLFTKALSASLSAAQDGNISIYREGEKAGGICYLTGQPADGNYVEIGLVGFVQRYTFKTALTGSANEVFIGATVADTALNLKKAINDEGVEATNYGTGTAINPHVTAAVDGAILSLTDKIGCNRLLGWAFAKSGANISVLNPIGGVDGVLIATIQVLGTTVFNAISLDDEELALHALPGLVDWTSDPVAVSGKNFSLHISSENVATAMAAKYQYSTQASAPTIWRDGISAVADLDNNSQIITPGELVPFVRLKINNTNAAAASVNAKIVFG